MSSGKLRALLVPVARLFLGGFAGAVTGIAFSAAIGFALGLIIGGAISAYEAFQPPTAVPEGMAEHGLLSLAFLLGHFSIPFGLVAGTLAGASALGTGRVRLGLIASAILGVLPSAVVCLDPNWYGGLELGSFPGCLAPGSVFGAIAGLTGAIIAVLATRLFQACQGWRREKSAVHS